MPLELGKIKIIYKKIMLLIISLICILVCLLIGCSFYLERAKQNDLSESLQGIPQYQVEIMRDTWGVPHVFGKTDADTAHGLAYAHAEDDFETIQELLLTIKGKLASVMGKDLAPYDYYVQLFRIWDDVNEKYDTLSADIRSVCEAYANGLNLYASQHPQLLERNIWPVKGTDIVAGFVHKLPLFFGVDNVLKQIYQAEKNPKVSQSELGFQQGIGSNFLAVGPNRSADGATRVAINTHQPWEGLVAWYEAHVVSEEGLNLYGGLFPGSPIVLLGHNQHLAWGHTINYPDLIDVYKLEINPNNPNEYRFDGQWRSLEIRKVPIEIRLWRNFRWTFHRETLWSVHGPALRNANGVYAIRYAGIGEIGQVEQWYRMGKAKNLEEFKAAMRLHTIPMFNTGYADRRGNLYYVYNALLPLRNEQYDWSGYVKGNSSSTLWTRYLSYDDLPQVENPPSAFLQSCNNNPFQTTIGFGNPNPLEYSSVFGIEDMMTNRSLRARELFGNNSSVTRKEFFQYKFDKYYSQDSVLAENLRRFLEEATAEDSELVKAIDLIRSWDFQTDIENRAAALVILTFRPKDRPTDFQYDYPLFLKRLRENIELLNQNFGRIDVTWGEINRLIHGDIDLPIAGGPDILRAIYSQPIDGGRLKGVAGDCFFQIVEWDGQGNLQSWVINQYGSHSWKKTSPHYTDQSLLFAREEMRPTWFAKEDILENLERRYSPGQD